MKSPVKVKICGITRKIDALKAVEFGADALGFVFFEGSPRHILPEKSRDIISEILPFITTVGVFVNEHPSKINEIRGITGIDVIQLHGDEPYELCQFWPRVIKAFRVRNFGDLNPIEECKQRCNPSAYLLDTFSQEALGGTGQIFNWDIAFEAKRYGPVILAGGLTPDNIEKAVRWVNPYAVDVSSGVEKEKGIKDERLMKTFIERAKSVSY